MKAACSRCQRQGTLVIKRTNLRYLLTPFRSFGAKQKVTLVEDAISLIRSNDTISVSGFVAQGTPETLLRALGDRFRATSEPKDLELIFGGGPGDYNNRGLNHLAQPGMLKRVIGGHYGQVPHIAKMALDNEIEAYCMPLGSISRMLRAAASASPGHITKVGFGTYIDPAQTGGRLNAKSTDHIVSKVEILGEDYLCYKALPINVALIRATTADVAGNLSFEKESLYTDARIIAMAARSSGGVVIAQVERIAEASSLPMRSVHIPAALVDCVVVADKEEDSWQSYFTKYNPSWSGEIREPLGISHKSVVPLTSRKIIARRAALELRPDYIVNLGIGMPEGVADVAREESIFPFTTLTTEGGVFGGIGAGGHDFGPASCADAVVEMNQQFDFYNGGGVDICFLGLAQCGANGDVNVSRLSSKSLTGPGGFIDISQCTPRVIFMGTFRKKNFEMELKTLNDTVTMAITAEGKLPTFDQSVSEVTFSARTALQRGQRVLYITERAVFELTYAGLELVEIAPGIDIDKDILQQMEFKPIVHRDRVKLMDSRIFQRGRMGLVDDLFSVKKAVQERVEYNPDAHTVYLDLSGMVVHDVESLEEVFAGLEEKYKELSDNCSNPFHTVVNYDGFSLLDSLSELWAQHVDRLTARYYKSSCRYAGRAFMRHKLAKDLVVKNEDEFWNDFQQGNGDRQVLDRVQLQEALRTYHHLRVGEPVLNALMQDKAIVSRAEFPGLLKRINKYEKLGHV